MNVAEGTELTALRMGVSRAFEGLSKSCSGHFLFRYIKR
jgi:hypothetical protein